MSTAVLIKKPTPICRQHKGPLAVHMDAFSARLSREGHSQPSGWCNVNIVGNFSLWLTRKGIDVERIDEAIVGKRSGKSS